MQLSNFKLVKKAMRFFSQISGYHILASFMLNHWDWALLHIAQGFNVHTCGSHLLNLHVEGAS